VAAPAAGRIQPLVEAKKGPLQPDEWAAPTTHTRDDEGEVEETRAGDDAGDVAAADAEFKLQGGDEEEIRARNQFGARVTSASGELVVFNGPQARCTQLQSHVS
jgi:hypothetical protein